MKPLALTCGDPAGVGPEIVATWLANASPKERAGVVVLGPAHWLETLPLDSGQRVATGRTAYVATPGQPDADGARAAWEAMERAAAGTAHGAYSGVVTGPVSKGRLAEVGYPFPGQTEFFAAQWGGDPTMAFAGGRLSVVLLTWHIPLREVREHLHAENFARTISAAEELARLVRSLAPRAAAGAPVPGAARIGVCGLNPHAGEGGLLGTEERDIIDPLLDGLRPLYSGLSRCEPGDTLFARQLRGEFDAIVALYHDQGLAPLKAVDFDDAVNLTLGLPHVRTSPDHGTAFGIAGRGVASGRSFARAVELARALARLREASGGDL